MLPEVSNTFHGRDIFAAAAAHLANEVSIKEFGPEICDVIQPTFTKVTQNEDRCIGEILYVDDFGNIITNISKKGIEQIKKETLKVELPNTKLQLKFVKTYAEAKPQEPVALIGSHNYVEIALNQGSAATKFQIKAGDKISLSPA
jgi:S-adenosylmethionine hydrolase